MEGHLMRFVCAGDLHLGSGADLHPDGAKARLAEQEEVLGQIVDAANELEAPLLWAGDAWEHRRPTPAQVLAFKRQLDRLAYGAVVIPGNHDVEAFEEPTGYDLAATGLVVANHPTLVTGNGRQIACLPWAPPHRLVALDESGDRDRIHERLAEGLLEIARGMHAQMNDDTPKILLGHWSISGAGLPSGIPTDQLREPVIPLEALASIGFDAVVFGHIHRPQTLNDAGGSPIFYVGSPMPLNFGETTTDHGCWLLDLEHGPLRTGAGAYRIPLDYPQLQTIDARAGGDGDALAWDGGLDLIQGATVKLRIAATEEQARRLPLLAIKERLLEFGARHVWSIQIETEKAALERGATVDEGLDDLETFDRWLDEQDSEQTDGERQGIRDRHAAIVQGRL
jgi:exonuclease SbcD